MPDDKSKIGGPDRKRVAGGEDYEVRTFAKRNNITQDQARALIRKFGNDRKTLEEEARKLATVARPR